MMPHHRLMPLCLALWAGLFLTSPRVGAEVTRVDVASRSVVGASGYEKIIGTAHFSLDPKNPHNSVVADIDKAPLNAAGRVEFSGDLCILRPLDTGRANGVALVDVVNRGRKMIVTSFNRGAMADPASEADLGDGFLLRQGYTLVFVAWEFDVSRQGGLMSLDVPAAQGASGFVRGEVTPNDRGATQTVTDLAGYTPAEPGAPDIKLVVRDGPFGPAQSIARDRFTLTGNAVTLAGGFEPGRTYELSYRPERFPIAGLGMAAFRDVAAWIKRAPDALAHAPRAVAFGSSQSGRFLRTFLYYGFNADEHGIQVFDGVMAHIAGAARLSLNERGATPTGLSMFVATSFPFANAADRDPISGAREGVLDNARARDHQPKVFFTNTAVEYWGGGRSAALIHTSPDGATDLVLPENTRAYFLTGAQHGPARFPTRVSLGQQPDNPVEYAFTMRALLVAMTRWVKEGAAPPASQVPRLGDGTLVPVGHVRFPAVPGVRSPKQIAAARHGGKVLPFLVPQVDDDGNEISGVRTAEILVPMATYTGWNFRGAAIGGSEQLVSLLGSAVPLPRTKAEAAAHHDPRRPLDERYPSREGYLGAAREVNDALIRGGYLLATDAADVMKRLEAHWGDTKN